MIVEYIRYTIPADRAPAFEAAYTAASGRSPLRRIAWATSSPAGSKSPNYILRIEWDSVEGHEQGFRRSPEFRQFLQHIRPYIADIAEMRHYGRCSPALTHSLEGPRSWHAWAQCCSIQPSGGSHPRRNRISSIATRRDVADAWRVERRPQWNLIANIRLALFTALAVLVGWALIDAALWKWSRSLAAYRPGRGHPVACPSSSPARRSRNADVGQ